MKFYGYEDSDALLLNTEFFKGAKLQTWYNKAPTTSYYRYGNWTTFYPTNDTAAMRDTLTGYNSAQEFIDEFRRTKMIIPEAGDPVYFDKLCTVPRVKCEQMFRRVIKIAKAKVVVIPYPKEIRQEHDIMVFAADIFNRLYIVARGEKFQIPVHLGMTLGEIFELCKPNMNPDDIDRHQQFFQATKDAKCIYMGNAYVCESNTVPFLEALHGLYPRVIFETDLVKLSSPETAAFTEDSMKSLIDLLGSDRRDNVLLGLKTMAGMDYGNYPSIARYILGQTGSSWSKCKPFPSAVQYMIKFLKADSWRLKEPFSDVSEEEFDLAKKLMLKILTDNLDSYIRTLKGRTNIDVDIDYTVDVSYKKPDNNREASPS